jgi:hypothetical protein
MQVSAFEEPPAEVAHALQRGAGRVVRLDFEGASLVLVTRASGETPGESWRELAGWLRKEGLVP